MDKLQAALILEQAGELPPDGAVHLAVLRRAGELSPRGQTGLPWEQTSSTTAAPTTTDGATGPQSLPRAALTTGAGILRRAGQGAANLTTPRGILPALDAVGRLLTPVTPAGAGEMIAGTMGRMEGQPPDVIEQGEQLGGTVAGVGGVAPQLLRGAAHLLSPTLRRIRGAERTATTLQRGAATEQLGASVAQAGQLADRAPAGTLATEATESIAKRLQGVADDTAKPASLASANQTFVDRASVKQYRKLQQSPAQDVDPATNRLVQPREGGKFVAAETPLTEGDFSRTFLHLRKTNERAGQAVMDFERRVTQKLNKVGPVKTSEIIANDLDLRAAILQHATPIEASMIERAVTAGLPLSKVPFTADELAALGREGVEAARRGVPARGVGSALLHFGLPGAGLGYLVHAAAMGNSGMALKGAAVGGTVLAGRLMLRGLDAAIASDKGRTALAALRSVQPGAPEASAILAAAISEGLREPEPKRLRPAQR